MIHMFYIHRKNEDLFTPQHFYILRKIKYFLNH